jgi:Asp-tRNA(Asn)/Glu-tRNA(Gln) amidotransferase A subunit family amidase
MLQQLRSGLISAQEVHELCMRKIRATRNLNAYIKVLEDSSKSQALKAVQKYEKGMQIIPVSILIDSTFIVFL